MKSYAVAAFAALAAAAPVERSTDAPFGIKKGLAYNQASATNVLSRPGSATWAYNWGTALNAPKFQQIPMFWGAGSMGDSAGCINAVKAGSPYVLGYNEPDESQANGGSHTSPQAAYNAWGDDMFKFSDAGAKLVCPAITSWDTTAGHTGGPAGFTWLRDFLNADGKNNPAQFRCTAQALHWYGTAGKSGAQQADDFIGYISNAHTQIDSMFHTTNMDLWITEFAPLEANGAASTTSQIMVDFLNKVIPWLDQQVYVARYSPFMADSFVSGNSLTASGNTFVSGK